MILECTSVSDITDLDISGLTILFDNIEHIIPYAIQRNRMRQKSIMDLKKFYGGYIHTIKDERNYLSHYSPVKRMSDRDFNERWKRVREAIEGICYYSRHIKLKNLKDLGDLRTISLDPYTTVKIDCLYDSMSAIDAEKCSRNELDDLEDVIKSLSKKGEQRDTNLMNLQILFEEKNEAVKQRFGKCCFHFFNNKLTVPIIYMLL